MDLSLFENFTEDLLEQAAIEILEEMGYSYAFGPDIAYDGDSPERFNYKDVILEQRVREEAVQGLQIPPGHLTVAVIQRVVKITDQQDTVEFSQRKNLNSVSSAASAAERGRTERSPERSG